MNGDSTKRESSLTEDTVAATPNDYGGSQFAYPLSILSGSMSETNGLTKRELFSVMALQGWLSGRQSWMGIEDGPAKAVRLADALLKELAK